MSACFAPGGTAEALSGTICGEFFFRAEINVKQDPYNTRKQLTLADVVAAEGDTTPETVDGVAFARLYGEPLFEVPDGLYIPPDALKVFLESFEGPLDLLLYLIRRQKFDVMDIPMALVTEQYMGYVELIRENNLELAAD